MACHDCVIDVPENALLLSACFFLFLLVFLLRGLFKEFSNQRLFRCLSCCSLLGTLEDVHGHNFDIFRRVHGVFLLRAWRDALQFRTRMHSVVCVWFVPHKFSVANVQLLCYASHVFKRFLCFRVDVFATCRSRFVVAFFVRMDTHATIYNSR